MTDKNSEKSSGGPLYSGRFTYPSGTGSFRERGSAIPPTKEQREEMARKGREIHRPLPGPSDQLPAPDDAVPAGSEAERDPDPGAPPASTLMSPAAIRKQFGVMGESHGSTPPDGTGVSDLYSFLVTTNQQVWGYDRNSTGNYTWMTLDQFFGDNLIEPPSTVDTFDPYTVPDPTAGQYVSVALNHRETNEPGVFLGSTLNGDVLGDWQYTWISCASLGMAPGLWFDYPRVATSSLYLTITVNVFDNNKKFVDAYVLVVDKFTYYDPVPITVLLFKGSASSTVPAISYEAIDDQYMVAQEKVNDGKGHCSVRLYIISGDFFDNSVKIKPPVFINADLPFVSSGTGDIGPQKSKSNMIAVDDTRMQSAVVRDGSLWCCQMVFLPLGGTYLNTGIQVYQIDRMKASLVQAARYYDTAQDWFYAYPSIAVNSIGDVLVGMAAFNKDVYPEGVYTCRAAGDPLNELRKKNTALKSPQPWTQNHRWGDYSATIVDPVDDLSFWTLQEISVDGAQWQNYWMQVPQITGN